MQIIEFDAARKDLIAASYEVLIAAHQADTPENPPMARRFFETLFTHLFPGRAKHWFAAVEGERVVGFSEVGFWTESNPELGFFRLTVHPDHRRQGTGTALLDRVIELCRDNGRTNLTTGTALNWENGPERSENGARFLEKHGFELALTGVNRRSSVDALDKHEEDRLHDKALAAAGDAYELRQWVGPVPEDLAVTMCRMESMIMSEIPLGELEIEPEQVDTEKLRAMEVVRRVEGRIHVNTVAVDRATGEAVGWSEIEVDEGPYTAAGQGITIVDPGHRGHRLGLLTKLANLRLLREHFPHITEIWTDNADVNAHMIDINATLGYETVDAIGDYQRRLEN